jgi:tight adherence protein C
MTAFFADPLLLLPIVVFFMVFGLALVPAQRQSRVSERLARYRFGATTAAPVAPAPTRLLPKPRLEVFQRLGARFSSEKATQRAKTLLLQAGSPMTLQAYTRRRQLFTFVLTPIFAFLALAGLGLKPLGFAAAVIVVLALPRLPEISLKRKAKQRGQEMDNVMADVLDLLVVCVEGGLSLAAGLMQVANRMDNVASEEFQRLLDDINSGISRRDAFLALADRVQSESLAITATTIIQADKVGMSIAHTLRTLSETMRTRRRQAAETKARQAPIKMMPVLVGFMLPAMLALLIGPVALEVMRAFR